MRYMVRAAWEIYSQEDGKTIRLEHQESIAFRKAAELNREVGEEFDVEKERARLNRKTTWD